MHKEYIIGLQKNVINKLVVFVCIKLVLNIFNKKISNNIIFNNCFTSKERVLLVGKFIMIIATNFSLKKVIGILLIVSINIVQIERATC